MGGYLRRVLGDGKWFDIVDLRHFTYCLRTSGQLYLEIFTKTGETDVCIPIIERISPEELLDLSLGKEKPFKS